MIRFFEDEGPLRIYQMPKLYNDEDGPQGVYVIGADVAEGLEHGDYSCAHVIDVRTGSQCAVWHGHVAADDFGQELYKLGRFYNNALVGCESNNHGLTTITVLRQLNYPRIYRDRNIDDITGKVTTRFGFRTDKKTKPVILDELAGSIREHEIELYDKPTIYELKTFIRDEKAKLHGSPHDDRVMALAIAWKMMDHAHAQDPINPVDDKWSWDWWARQLEKPSGVVPIGTFNRRKR